MGDAAAESRCNGCTDARTSRGLVPCGPILLLRSRECVAGSVVIGGGVP